MSRNIQDRYNRALVLLIICDIVNTIIFLPLLFVYCQWFPHSTGTFFLFSLRYLLCCATKIKLSPPNQHLSPKKKLVQASLSSQGVIFSPCSSKRQHGASSVILKTFHFGANVNLHECLPAMVAVTYFSFFVGTSYIRLPQRQ